MGEFMVYSVLVLWILGNIVEKEGQGMGELEKWMKRLNELYGKESGSGLTVSIPAAMKSIIPAFLSLISTSELSTVKEYEKVSFIQDIIH